MDRKYIIIAGGIFISTIIILLLLHILNKDNILVTCTSYDNLQKWSFDVENDKIKNLNLEITYPAQDFEFDTLKNITDYEKQEIQNIKLNEIGIDSLNNDGLTIKFEYNDNLLLKLKIDTTKVSQHTLEKLSLDNIKKIKFSDLKTKISKDNYYSCK